MALHPVGLNGQRSVSPPPDVLTKVIIALWASSQIPEVVYDTAPVLLASTGVLIGCVLVICRFYHRARNHIDREMQRNERDVLRMRYQYPVGHAYFPYTQDYGYPRGGYFRIGS